MEIPFTPEQESRLNQIAREEGITVARLVQNAVDTRIESDTHFRESVRKGIRQAEQGLFIEENEMDARIAQYAEFNQ
jgi:predicted transcriptional regulator